MIKRVFETVILGLHTTPGPTRGNWRVVKNGREVETFGLPVIDGRFDIEHIDAADHIVEFPEAEFGHVLAHLLGDEEEEIDDVLGLPLKLLAQNRILRCDADRARVQVALAHHDAAHRDERSGSESKFFGAEKRGDGYVASGLQLAVGLDADAAAKVVKQQNLLCFCQAEVPGNSGVLDGAEGRCAGASGIAANQDHIGVCLRDAGCYGAYADFRHEFHRDARLRIDVLQVVDQLREIFDRVNVVMRRRRDQTHTGNGVPQTGDDVVHFVPGQLASLARLCALRHLDLKLVSVDQVVCGYAEARRSYLLDGTAAQISVRIWLEAFFIFAALASIRLAADTVHGNRERFVGFFTDGTEGHCASGEALYDLFGGFDLFQRNGIVGLLQFHQSAKRAEVRAL